MEQKRFNKIFANVELDVYVKALLDNAIKERDDLIAKEPTLRKIQEKIDTSMENINGFEDRLLILAAATRFMTECINKNQERDYTSFNLNTNELQK